MHGVNGTNGLLASGVLGVPRACCGECDVPPTLALPAGYRSVPLKNSYSEDLELAALLIHMEIVNAKVSPPLAGTQAGPQPPASRAPGAARSERCAGSGTGACRNRAGGPQALSAPLPPAGGAPAPSRGRPGHWYMPAAATGLRP